MRRFESSRPSQVIALINLFILPIHSCLCAAPFGNSVPETFKMLASRWGNGHRVRGRGVNRTLALVPPGLLLPAMADEPLSDIARFRSHDLERMPVYCTAATDGDRAVGVEALATPLS